MENYFIIKSKKKERDKKKNQKELLIKKSNLNYLTDFKFQKKYALKLSNILNKPENIMNLFIYGNNGVGKSTLAKAYINEYLGNIDDTMRLEIIKTETKELEYFKYRNFVELVIYKYNFNDCNLINKFFKEICFDSSTFSSRKNIIIIKNIHLIRIDNIYLFKNNIEKYLCNNIFIFISLKSVPKLLEGFFCPMRIDRLSNDELVEFTGDIVQDLNVKNIIQEDIKEIVNNSGGNLSILKNNIQYSYLSDRYCKFLDDTENKFMLIYKLLKKKTIKNFGYIREVLNELLIENISVSDLLKFLVKKFMKSKSLDNIQKHHIISYIIKCDMGSVTGFRSIIHLEHTFLQIINIL